MEHPPSDFFHSLMVDKVSMAKIIGYNIPFITINAVAPAVDIVLKLIVAVVTVVGVFHTMHINKRRLENELKKKEKEDNK